MIRELAGAVVIGWIVAAWAGGALDSAYAPRCGGSGGRCAIAVAP